MRMTLAYTQGGEWLVWTTASEPNLALYAARDPSVLRIYQEDHVLNVVRSVPLKIDRVCEIVVRVEGELCDVFDGTEEIIAVVIQRPSVRLVSVRSQ